VPAPGRWCARSPRTSGARRATASSPSSGWRGDPGRPGPRPPAAPDRADQGLAGAPARREARPRPDEAAPAPARGGQLGGFGEARRHSRRSPNPLVAVVSRAGRVYDRIMLLWRRVALPLLLSVFALLGRRACAQHDVVSCAYHGAGHADTLEIYTATSRLVRALPRARDRDRTAWCRRADGRLDVPWLRPACARGRRRSAPAGGFLSAPPGRAVPVVFIALSSSFRSRSPPSFEARFFARRTARRRSAPVARATGLASTVAVGTDPPRRPCSQASTVCAPCGVPPCRATTRRGAACAPPPTKAS
jgi:hypothetical protein